MATERIQHACVVAFMTAYHPELTALHTVSLCPTTGSIQTTSPARRGWSRLTRLRWAIKISINRAKMRPFSQTPAFRVVFVWGKCENCFLTYCFCVCKCTNTHTQTSLMFLFFLKRLFKVLWAVQPHLTSKVTVSDVNTFVYHCILISFFCHFIFFFIFMEICTKSQLLLNNKANSPVNRWV